MVASLQVHTNHRIWVKGKIHIQDIQRDVVIVKLIVAEGNVNVNSMEVLVFNEKFLIDFGCFFKMASQIVKRGHAELVLHRVGKGAMIVHNLILITHFLSKLEEQSVLQRGIFRFLYLLLGLFVVAKGVLAASLE